MLARGPAGRRCRCTRATPPTRPPCPGVIDTVKERFGIERVILVGDRAMITDAHAATLKELGAGFVSALKSRADPQADRAQAICSCRCSIRPTSPRSPRPSSPASGWWSAATRTLAAERARKREDLLAATERELDKVNSMVASAPRHAPQRADAGKIGERAGARLNKYKVAKHFELADRRRRRSPTSARPSRSPTEAALDGLYVLRTTCPTEQLTTQAVVRVYKQLKMAERAYRTIKDALDVRPIRHHLQDRVEAHFFLFLLAYYLLFELQARLAPMLFTDDTPLTPADPVAPARRSPAANTKAGQRPHPRRAARLQPHRPDRRARHRLPQPTPHRRQPPHLPPPHQPQHHPSQSARTPRRQARHVAKAKPAAEPPIPRQHAGFVISRPKTSA